MDPGNECSRLPLPFPARWLGSFLLSATVGALGWRQSHTYGRKIVVQKKTKKFLKSISSRLPLVIEGGK